MTTAAWTMLGITWGVILFFTGKFFWKVLRTPHALETEDGMEERAHDGTTAVPFKDA